MKKIVVVAGFALLTGCAAVKLAQPTQADIDKSNKYPGYTLAEMNKGKALFEEKCDQCHRLKPPASKTEEKWNKIVPRMAAKANKKTVKIDEQQQELILKYLVTASIASRK